VRLKIKILLFSVVVLVLVRLGVLGFILTAGAWMAGTACILLLLHEAQCVRRFEVAAFYKIKFFIEKTYLKLKQKWRRRYGHR